MSAAQIAIQLLSHLFIFRTIQYWFDEREEKNVDSRWKIANINKRGMSCGGGKSQHDSESLLFVNFGFDDSKFSGSGGVMNKRFLMSLSRNLKGMTGKDVWVCGINHRLNRSEFRELWAFCWRHVFELWKIRCNYENGCCYEWKWETFQCLLNFSHFNLILSIIYSFLSRFESSFPIISIPFLLKFFISISLFYKLIISITLLIVLILF